jgi:hypothetical protein
MVEDRQLEEELESLELSHLQLSLEPKLLVPTLVVDQSQLLGLTALQLQQDLVILKPIPLWWGKS